MMSSAIISGERDGRDGRDGCTGGVRCWGGRGRVLSHEGGSLGPSRPSRCRCLFFVCGEWTVPGTVPGTVPVGTVAGGRGLTVRCQDAGCDGCHIISLVVGEVSCAPRGTVRFRVTI